MSSRAVKALALIAALALGVAGRPVMAADDLNSVLAKLDAASAKFKSATADITSDNVQTQPIPDSDTMTGTVVFARVNGQLQMAMHLKTDNGKPVPKDVIYAGGLLKFYEPLQKQVQVFKAGPNNASQADTILTLGFGGSGQELQKSWAVSFAGVEQVDGKPAEKLELVPKDLTMKNNFPKVELWVDAESGLGVKQQFFDASGNYRMVSYRHVVLNGPVGAGAFDLKTPPGTQIVNR